MNQIDKIGKRITETADSIYYLGYPSQATLDISMPDTINEILIFNETQPNYIRFRFNGANGVGYAIYYTRAPLLGGGNVQSLNVTNFLTAGVKRLIVNITQENKIMLTPKVGQVI
jgi:hypothetical protein